MHTQLATTHYPGDPIPRCPCGKPVYADDLCYHHFQCSLKLGIPVVLQRIKYNGVMPGD